MSKKAMEIVSAITIFALLIWLIAYVVKREQDAKKF